MLLQSVLWQLNLPGIALLLAGISGKHVLTLSHTLLQEPHDGIVPTPFNQPKQT